jgi:hypothetical protein
MIVATDWLPSRQPSDQALKNPRTAHQGSNQSHREVLLDPTSGIAGILETRVHLLPISEIKSERVRVVRSQRQQLSP